MSKSVKNILLALGNKYSIPLAMDCRWDGVFGVASTLHSVFPVTRIHILNYKDWPQVGLAKDGSSAYTPTPTYTNLFIDEAIELGKPCPSLYETEKLSKRL